MSRSNLKPIDMRAQFGARTLQPSSKPVSAPAAKALYERQMDERLQYASTPIRNSNSRQPYTGGELSRSERAGAMDAFDLLSIQMGQLVRPKGSVL